jgi:prolyl-tRNA editing enzyme YbaK/EbsC (Cys-tRNA(Pro) deacylase)
MWGLTLETALDRTDLLAAVAETFMEYGGITPFGLPSAWPVLVDKSVTEQPYVVVGSGVRRSKLVVPGAALAEIETGEVLPDLAR